jgi:hypothetical protein
VDEQKIFFGLRDAEGLKIYACEGPTCVAWNGHSGELSKLALEVKALPLDLRLDLANHSPTGFECGYAGSGPAQTALAVAAAVFGDAQALRVYQTLKERAIAGLPRDRSWMLTERDVREVLGTPAASLDLAAGLRAVEDAARGPLEKGDRQCEN